jgi:hypothetical protein
MGENIENNGFKIKDDGTIIRGRKCPKCGKESYAEGDYCEHCGARMVINTSSGNGNSNWWKWLLLVLFFSGILIPVIYLSESNSNNYEWVEETVDTVVAESSFREQNGYNNTMSKRQNESLIYSQDHDQKCDGLYADKVDFFSVNLYNINRRHFKITFSFNAETYDGTWWHEAIQYPLMLSEGYRILGICLHNDGSIYIETNNMRNKYETGLIYCPGEYRNIDLEYNHGRIIINGEEIDVEMDETNGDNILSSINYSSGNAFYGTISQVRVYNITD